MHNSALGYFGDSESEAEEDENNDSA